MFAYGNGKRPTNGSPGAGGGTGSSKNHRLGRGGLRWWQRPLLLSPNGQRLFLLTIACEGGLPLRLLEQQGAQLTQFFRAVLDAYYRAGQGGPNAARAITGRLVHLLTATLRQDPVLQLTGDLIAGICALQPLVEGVGDPIAYLDTHHEGWRRTLPLRLDDQIAERLLEPDRDRSLVRIPADSLARLSEGGAARVRVGMLRLWAPGDELLALAPCPDDPAAWTIPDELDPGPWWVIARDGDWARFRPLLWSVAAAEGAPTATLTPLAEAIRQPIPVMRQAAINRNLKELACQPDSPDWPLLCQYIDLGKRFPPTSLELPHARMLQLTWANGEQWSLRLDQGLGYWMMPRRRQRAEFPFTAAPDTQTRALANASPMVVAANPDHPTWWYCCWETVAV